ARAEKCRFRHGVVRALAAGWNAALVAPPGPGPAPVGFELGCVLVGVARSRAAREDDVAARASLLRKPLGDQPGSLRGVVRNGDVDRGHPPSASSRDRSIAAWIALRKAARTPACSSSRIAAIVVPPREDTDSRRP